MRNKLTKYTITYYYNNAASVIIRRLHNVYYVHKYYGYANIHGRQQQTAAG